ncbi:MAG TPA: TerC family protein [Gemmatimonadales bacterium]|nr:TerC family protein [Gemmatimonadales bacterium]
MGHSPAVWLGFSGLVVALLALDLGVLNRRSHVLSFREAVSWSLGWISLALLFGVFLLWREGTRPALEYFTGYLIELSLSVDNLFVFILIFQYFAVPAALQPRVLKWGIVGAVVMRAVMIGLGAFLLARFDWIRYVFGAIVIVTGIKMITQEEMRVEPERNPVVRLAHRFLPFTRSYEGQHFLVRDARGRWLGTPLLLVLLVVESTDLVFAVDSIPAIFAVTSDPFIVYTSNIFAILGLRALFFVLAGMLDKFVYLKPGVAGILVFVGIKMVASHWVHVPIALSLGIIIATLALAVAASIVKARRDEAARGEARLPS